MDLGYDRMMDNRTKENRSGLTDISQVGRRINRLEKRLPSGPGVSQESDRREAH
jgi:hypothetical protein